MSLAHYLTVFRIIVSPLFPILYLEYAWLGIPFTTVPFLLLMLLSICEYSDLADGIIARRRNQVSDLGKVLDPMADSIMRITLFLTFTQGPVSLPLPIVLVFLYRDFLVSTLRTLCALKGIALAARISGKAKAVIQACVLFLILILLAAYTMGSVALESLQMVSLIAVSFAAIYAVVSAADYFYSNRVYVKKALQA